MECIPTAQDVWQCVVRPAFSQTRQLAASAPVNMRAWHFPLMLVALIVSGCALTAEHQTPSGKPETTIAADPAEVRAMVTNRMIDQGYSISRQSDAALVFDRPVTNSFAAKVYGNRYDTRPNWRLMYTFAPEDGETRVIADVMIVTKPGTNAERVDTLNRHIDSLEVQTVLDEIKAALE